MAFCFCVVVGVELFTNMKFSMTNLLDMHVIAHIRGMSNNVPGLVKMVKKS